MMSFYIKNIAVMSVPLPIRINFIIEVSFRKQILIMKLRGIKYLKSSDTF